MLKKIEGTLLSVKIPIKSNTTTNFSLEKQPMGTDRPVPAKWHHSGALCSYVWRHIFSILIWVNLLWMVVYIYEFSLQSIKATWFNRTFPRTFWSPFIWESTSNQRRCSLHCICRYADSSASRRQLRFGSPPTPNKKACSELMLFDKSLG